MPTDWCHSDEFREIARRSGQRNARIWWQQLPRCGAHARTTGKPCQRPGFGSSGRCHVHGGLTPRGDHWHRLRRSRDPAKLGSKLDRLEKDASKRRRKIEAMTPAERAAWEHWHDTHKPTSAAARAAARLERQRHREIKELLAGFDDLPSSPEIQEAAEAADVARLRLAALQQSPAPRDRPMIDDDLDDGEDQRRATIIKRARGEGIQAAYLAALRIAKDPKSPAQAASAAARTLLEIGGLLDQRDRAQEAALEDRSPSEYTAAELGAMVNKIRRRRLSEQNGDANGADTAGGVFD